VFGFVLSLFAARLVELQGLDASAYADEAIRERLIDVTLTAPRGSITDSNGVALATSVEARNVTADPTLVSEKAETARALSPLLGLDEPTLVGKLSVKGQFVYLAKEIPPDRWRDIAALKLPGIFSEKVTRRVYPAGQIAANVVGFVNAEGRGAGGIEDSLDKVLAGRNGKATYEAGAGGRQIPLATNTQKDPVTGGDVQLTIDRDIQWKAQEELAKAVRATGSEAGVAVVQDVRTGEILAMAAAPTFDPNDPGSYKAGVRGNRALGEAYEPGSTGKVLTASALIEENAVRPGTVFSVPNRLTRAGKSFKDFEDHETQRMTYAGTIARSSNIGTILAAERMGLEKLHPYFAKFGIGRPTGIGFPGETSGALPPLDSWSKTTGYTLTFGQGYSVNAVQMTSAFATVANGGIRVEPSLVKGVTGPDGTFKASPKPASTRVVSEKTADTVALLMEGVTGEGGTAPSANIPGYRVAGKTGTAQRYNSGCGCYRGYTMSFMGFAPADNPRLAVTVVLQAPKRGVGGGATAGPVFREVMSFALQTEGIPPTGSKPPKLRLFAE
jgi:cell division protein FtsI (penicillin-binding protein 3)